MTMLAAPDHSTVDAASLITGSREYQARAVLAVEHAHARGVQRPAVVAGTGAGKGFRLDELIPSPGGLTRMGDLAVGSLVYGSDGRPTEVTGIYDRGDLPTYRITFTDGTSVVCDGDHLWAVQTRKEKYRGRGYRVVETRALSNSAERLYIPMAAPVARPEADLPIHPYVMGVILGDGCTSGGHISITCQDDTADVVRGLLPPGATLKRWKAIGGGASTYHLNDGGAHKAALRDLGLWGKGSWDKFIPSKYLHASIEQRLSLIQGMCDTDGYVEPGKGSVDWLSVSRQMADDMSELVTSLGGKFKYRLKRTTWIYAGERKFSTAWRGTVTLPAGMCPVRMARKRAAFRPNTKYLPTRGIVSVEPAGMDAIRCITVAADDRLFLATRQHLVTHNTQLFSYTADRFLRRNPTKRVLVLAHRDELIEQAAKRLRQVAPHLPVGIVKAERNQTRSPIIVASVQTLAPRECRRARMIRDVGLIIIDECHRAAAKSYVDILTYYGAMTPGSGVVVLGVTATMSRSDEKSLGDVWQDVVAEIPSSHLVELGWLVRPTGVRIFVENLDLRKIRQSGGDYQDAALGLAIEQSLAPEKIAQAYIEHCPTRQAIGFAPTVHSAQVLSDAMRDRGVHSVVVSAKTPPPERKRAISEFRTGKVRVLWNVGIFTEGTDLPMCDVVIMARPTKSNGLYIQCVGRCMRLHCPADESHTRNPIVPVPSCLNCKTSAIVLDVVGVTSTMRLQAQIELFGEDKQSRPCNGCGERPCTCWCDGCNSLVRQCTCPCDGCGEPRPQCTCEDEENPAVPIEEIYDEGELRHAIVDLFTGSASVWTRTNMGVWFLPAGERLIAVLPAVRPAYWDVVAMHADKPGTGQLIAEGVDSMALAQKLAEDNVTTAERRTARKDRAWRSKPPTKDLASQARALGIIKPGDFRERTAGEIDSLITIAKASHRIDPVAWSIPHIRAAIEVPKS